jgi:succinoglycan biosynthesis transport protein ExoP
LNKFPRQGGAALTVAGAPEPNLASIPEQGPPPGMSVMQFSAILLAYWKQILVITFTVLLLGTVVIKFLPKTYTATATLIVNSDVKDPLAGRDFPVELINSYVATQIELMTSPVVLLPVVQKLDLMQDKEFTAGFSGSEDALREFVQKNLATEIAIERGIGGQLLYVSASAKTAAKAADIANSIADVYIEQDKRRLNDPAGERAQRYTEELAELRQKATIAQDKVTEFRKENGIGDMNAYSAGTEVQTLDTLHQRLLETQNLRRSLESKQSGSAGSGDEAVASPSVQSSKTLLDTQLSQLAQLSGTYGPQHPKVRELNAQIALTRQALATESHALSANTATELARTKELERKYAQAVAEQEAKVVKLRQAQDEGSKLVLELESAKSVYKQALDGFDQIMFQAVASHTNVSVVNRAVPPLRASKPNKLKLLLVVMVLSVALGVAGPLIHGLFFARRLRCRDDIERDFGIAVLAQLEAVPSLASTT